MEEDRQLCGSFEEPEEGRGCQERWVNGVCFIASMS